MPHRHGKTSVDNFAFFYAFRGYSSSVLTFAPLREILP